MDIVSSSAFGLEHLREISTYEEKRIGAICAAEIHDDYFRQVRVFDDDDDSDMCVET
jgi:hypothetical protein